MAAGDLTEWAMKGELPMTRATATVSPRARPMASVKPPRMPVRAPGMTTLRSTCHRVAPRAMAPSICSFGTTARTSREMATMVGRTITKRITPASSRPDPVVGPVEQPGPPEHRGEEGLDVLPEQRAPARSGPTARRPRSAPRPAARPRSESGGRRRSGTRWARATAVPRPMGTASTRAMAVVSMVPRMNGSSPYWWWLGSQTLLEDPREAEGGEGRPGLDDDRDHEPGHSATKIAATAIRMPR